MAKASLIHYASEFNKVEMIQALYAFKGGLKVNAKDRLAGWLYCAVHHGNAEAVELLLAAPFNADVAVSIIWASALRRSRTSRLAMDVCMRC